MVINDYVIHTIGVGQPYVVINDYEMYHMTYYRGRTTVCGD